MRRRRNPVEPRMKYVAKQYPAWVTLGTFQAFAEAMGAHGMSDHAARIVHDGDEAKNADKLARAVPMLMREWGQSSSTRYDRYLPWLARELNRIYKPYRKLAKRLELSEWPHGFDGGRWAYVFSPLDKLEDVGGARSDMDTFITMRDQSRRLMLRFRSVVDWAEANNVDLNQFDWSEATHEAQIWAEQQEREALVAEIVFEWPDGWTVQKLCSELQLAAEGEAMGNCLGTYEVTLEDSKMPVAGIEPDYCGQVLGEDARGDSAPVSIYSLRDQNGKPHATLEWQDDEGYVSQLRGKQNDVPSRKYLDRMVEFRLKYLDKLPAASEYRVEQAYHENADRMVDAELLLAFRLDRKHEPRTYGRGAVLLLFKDNDGEPVGLDEVEDTFRAMGYDLMDGYYEIAVEELEGVDMPPSVYWMLWRRFDVKEQTGPDEMVNWLAMLGVGPSSFRRSSPEYGRVGNPSGLVRHDELKRRLMR